MTIYNLSIDQIIGCKPETNIMLYANYISVKKKSFYYENVEISEK